MDSFLLEQSYHEDTRQTYHRDKRFVHYDKIDHATIYTASCIPIQLINQYSTIKGKTKPRFRVVLKGLKKQFGEPYETNT